VKFRNVLMALMAGLTSACSLLSPADPPKTAFDFGPSEGSHVVLTGMSQPFVVREVTAPSWMDDSAMYYRLIYVNPDNPLPYRKSVWVIRPTELLTQRLRAQLSRGTAHQSDSQAQVGYVLNGELLEFEQVFEAPGHSSGVLRLRATLEEGGHSVDRTFTIRQVAPTPDARGGVTALIRCVDMLAQQIAEWASTKGDGAPQIAKAPT